MVKKYYLVEDMRPWVEHDYAVVDWHGDDTNWRQFLELLKEKTCSDQYGPGRPSFSIEYASLKVIKRAVENPIPIFADKIGKNAFTKPLEEVRKLFKRQYTVRTDSD